MVSYSVSIDYDDMKILTGRQRLSIDINISTKYVYVRKHNRNEKATEIVFCKCNENQGMLEQCEIYHFTIIKIKISSISSAKLSGCAGVEPCNQVV